uniref:Lysosomal trafficking regulator lyst n=1 Tax=Brugia timori TaxID=42155 RepID=A0A0R3Q6T9_9BILA
LALILCHCRSDDTALLALVNGSFSKMMVLPHLHDFYRTDSSLSIFYEHSVTVVLCKIGIQVFIVDKVDHTVLNFFLP